MKKYYFLLLCFLTFSVLSAQETLSKEEQERREKNIQAGNPFAKFGYKAKVATLSKGKYLEVHDLDSIVTIGSIRYHVDKKEIVGNIVIDTTDMYARPIGDTPSRWLSPDPLSEEFPDWSPYTMCYDNPIKYVDPDGRAAYSPIYDSKTGKYLGVDSQGFLRGEVLFMDSSKYNQLSQNGRIDHNVAVNNSISISQLPSNEQGMNLFYKAVNHVSKTMDNWFYNNNPSENLFGKDIKVFSNQLGIGTKGSNPKGYSTGTIGQNDSMLDDGINPDKRIDRISMNFDYRNIINTAPNIFSLFEHEFYGHGENGWRNKVGQSEDPHKKVYNFQVNTFNFRHYVTGEYKELTLKKNEAQGN